MIMHRMMRQRTLGFTLAELLISLAVLGVIATFTIPKVLNASQNNQWNSQAKETIGAINEAYMLIKLNDGITATTSATNFLEKMNYVRLDTSSLVDHVQGAGSLDCALFKCYRLHSGAVLSGSGVQFNGTGNGCTVFFYYDPDGTYSGNTTGPGKSILLLMRYDGRITIWGDPFPGSYTNTCNTLLTANPTAIPPWFSW